MLLNHHINIAVEQLRVGDKIESYNGQEFPNFEVARIRKVNADDGIEYVIYCKGLHTKVNASIRLIVTGGEYLIVRLNNSAPIKAVYDD